MRVRRSAENAGGGDAGDGDGDEGKVPREWAD